MATGFVMVCYDIPDTKVRNRLVLRLFSYGLSRVQYSVFYGNVPLSRIALMIREIPQEFPKETDKILIIPLCKKCVSRLVQVHGSLQKKPRTFIVV
ncbi:MAG: CRISPR-associated endoribonuclease Cas2 1 [Methanoregula sp. PtaU1.Bin051]|nr:MAG: CRISPR-associated endoribonuclease Cas2 1 [Methanoregula sp. PtaU1.Bin051]